MLPDGPAICAARVVWDVGEQGQALDWLERAYAQRDGGLTRLRTAPLLESVRTDPRYAALVRKMNPTL